MMSLTGQYVIATCAEDAAQGARFGGWFRSLDAATVQATNKTKTDLCNPRCLYRVYRVTLNIEEVDAPPGEGTE